MRNSSFDTYKTETSSKIQKLVNESDRYKEHVNQIQNAIVNIQTENIIVILKI